MMGPALPAGGRAGPMPRSDFQMESEPYSVTSHGPGLVASVNRLSGEAFLGRGRSGLAGLAAGPGASLSGRRIHSQSHPGPQEAGLARYV